MSALNLGQCVRCISFCDIYDNLVFLRKWEKSLHDNESSRALAWTTRTLQWEERLSGKIVLSARPCSVLTNLHSTEVPEVPVLQTSANTSTLVFSLTKTTIRPTIIRKLLVKRGLECRNDHTPLVLYGTLAAPARVFHCAYFS